MSLKKLLAGLAVVLALVGTAAGYAPTRDAMVGNEALIGTGGDFQDATWKEISSYSGYTTKFDPSKVADTANPMGQNTVVNYGDRISIRDKGYEVFPAGTASAATAPITSIHTFRLRDGTNIMMRSTGTEMQYFNEQNDTWEALKGGYTSGQRFGYADININTDATSYVYFGNAVESFARWTGSYTLTNGALTGGETTVTVDDTSFFPATGTISVCGTELLYSAKTATTFTVASAPACADNRSVAQAIETFGSNPKGNIYMAFDNRLLIAGITATPQAVYFSKYGDATNYIGAALVTASTDADPDIFNLAEGGGGVSGMAQDENKLYIFKRSIIYKVTLTDTDYLVEPLKTFDGKSQTIGAQALDAIFTGSNGTYFITPDNQIMGLQRVETVDYPQVQPISDAIQPTVDNMEFGSATGIVWKDKAYFSAKASASTAYNDTVLVWNLKTKQWDSPIVGWNAGNWTIYDNGTTEDLYFASSNSTNVYKVTDMPLDDVYGVTANWRSKQFDFGNPSQQKQIVDAYVEGYIADNTTLTISLLLDEDGYTQRFTTDLKGTDTAYIYNSSEYNVFGLSPFGTKRFGSNDDLSGRKKFRVYLGKDFRASPFYNMQIDFASDGENQQWEVTDFAFKVRLYSQPNARNLYKAFK